MNRKQKVARKELIEDKAKRINLKSKRKRTLMRKAIEVSQMCHFDILIIIRDNETKRVSEYNSGSNDTEMFTFQDAVEALRLTNTGDFSKINYNDDDYESLKQQSREKNQRVIDEIEQALSEASDAINAN